MADPDNPYSPPAAGVDDSAFAERSHAFSPDGDLDKAVAGEIKLDAMAACKEGWARTKGMKLSFHIAFTVFSLVYVPACLIASAAAFYIGGFTDMSLFSDPEALSRAMQGMTSSVSYSVGVNVLMSPVNALGYLSFWNMGLRCAAGHQLRIVDAFPMKSLIKGSLVMVFLTPLGMLYLLHPFATYLSFPFWLLVSWTLPLFLDRPIGVVDALKVSARLTVNNIVGIVIFGVMMTAGSLVSILTCGIGFIWFLPFMAASMGAMWRQLAGLEATR